jgi:hypothetical protein
MSKEQQTALTDIFEQADKLVWGTDQNLLNLPHAKELYISIGEANTTDMETLTRVSFRLMKIGEFDAATPFIQEIQTLAAQDPSSNDILNDILAPHIQMAAFYFQNKSYGPALVHTKFVMECGAPDNKNLYAYMVAQCLQEIEKRGAPLPFAMPIATETDSEVGCFSDAAYTCLMRMKHQKLADFYTPKEKIEICPTLL